MGGHDARRNAKKTTEVLVHPGAGPCLGDQILENEEDEEEFSGSVPFLDASRKC